MCQQTKYHSNQLQVIVGLGKTGLSCVQYLTALLGNSANLAVTDDRENPEALAEFQVNFPTIPTYMGKVNVDLCAKAARIIVSPGVPLTEPAIVNALAMGIPVVGDIELFLAATQTPVIGITGSNGKSTVTTLLSEMAKNAGFSIQTGGNLGIPALNLLADTSSIPDFYILELSSFQLDTTPSIRTNAAVILNLSEDHMDRYSNMANYLIAKQKIYTNCRFPIVNRDHRAIWQDLNLANIISFGLDAPPLRHFGLRNMDGQIYLMKGETALISSKVLKIKGSHQLSNALAALALGDTMGLPMPAMLETLHNFQGLTHRCQWLRQLNEVDWYNDSKATNVNAAQAALTGLGAEIIGKLIVIAGGLGKNANFSELKDALSKYARCLILIGQDASIIAAAVGDNIPTRFVKTLEAATQLAYTLAKPGDAVILSPACASFDMFKNFEHRGEVFIKTVNSLS